MQRLACLLLSVGIGVACAGGPPAMESDLARRAPPQGPIEPAPPEPTLPAPPPPEPVTGRWTSTRCLARNYERVIALRSDGSVSVEDRISPCPREATCVWSGIVVTEGRWEADGAGVALHFEGDLGHLPTPLPRRLDRAEASSRLALLSDTRCAYGRVPEAAPETEDAARPREAPAVPDTTKPPEAALPPSPL